MDDNIFESCRKGDLVSVKYIVEEAEVNPEIQDEFKYTPLHHASYNGHLEIVKYFVEEVKVDTEVQNENGNTPLHHASYWGYLKIVKYFIQHDVDTSMENNNGDTFLDLVEGEKKERLRR